MGPIQKAAGFTLIELMVALVIGLALTLVITRMLASQEAMRRGVTSGSDLASNSAYAAYTLERELSTAGAGISQVIAENYGCLLNVSRNNQQLLPATAALPTPFASVSQNYRLAPLVVFAGAGAGGSDVIAMAAGASGLSETGLPVAPKSTAAGQLKLANTLGIQAGDLVLISQQAVGCMMEQVSAGFVGSTSATPQPTLTFGGSYAADTINGLSLTDFANGNAFVSLLGNVAGNQPRIQLIGLGANATLFSYDLLKLSQTTPQALMDGIVDMRVLYGVDTVRTGQRQVTAWIKPTASGYTAADLTTGSSAAQNNLQAILAVRVGLILRGDLIEKDNVSAGTLTLFSDLDSSVQYTFALPTDGTRQRYRAVEFTVPLRNVRFSR
jgi:type IV pilus assembly protein PilW